MSRRVCIARLDYKMCRSKELNSDQSCKDFDLIRKIRKEVQNARSVKVTRRVRYLSEFKTPLPWLDHNDATWPRIGCQVTMRFEPLRQSIGFGRGHVTAVGSRGRGTSILPAQLVKCAVLVKQRRCTALEGFAAQAAGLSHRLGAAD